MFAYTFFPTCVLLPIFIRNYYIKRKKIKCKNTSVGNTDITVSFDYGVNTIDLLEYLYEHDIKEIMLIDDMLNRVVHVVLDAKDKSKILKIFS